MCEDNESFYQIFFDKSQIPMCVADENGYFIKINDEFINLLGYSKDRLLSTKFIKFVHVDDIEKTKKEYEKILKEKKTTINFTNRYKKKDGAYVNLEWKATIEDDGYIYATAVDMTEKHNLISQLKNRNLFKNNFLSRMSHEMRTPLNAISGYSQLLTFNTRISRKYIDYIKKIENAVWYMANMLDEISLISSSQDETYRFSMEEVELENIIKSSIELIINRATKNNIKIILKNKYLKSTVYVDIQKFKECINNLLTNAVKYNKKNGSIVVFVTKEDNDFLKIHVKDTGNGISKEVQHRIFDPFDRLDYLGSVEGTGLGLTVTKTLIERMHGKIGFESKKDVGSDFWITIKAIKLNSEIIEDDISRVTSSNDEQEEDDIIFTDNEKKKNLIYIEDNEFNASLLKEIIELKLPKLRFSNYIMAKDGIDAVLEEDPDYLLLDLNLPDLHGFEVIDILKKKNFDISKIIIVTADANKITAQKVKSLGIKKLVHKPYKLDEIVTYFDD